MTTKPTYPRPPLSGRAIAIVEDTALRAQYIAQLSDILSTGLHDGGDPEELAVAAVAALEPRDLIEVSWAAKIAGVGHSGMECLRLAGFDNQKPAARDMELRHGEKLISLHMRLLNSFDRRRIMTDMKKAVPDSPLTFLGYRF